MTRPENLAGGGEVRADDGAAMCVDGRTSAAQVPSTMTTRRGSTSESAAPNPAGRDEAGRGDVGGREEGGAAASDAGTMQSSI